MDRHEGVRASRVPYFALGRIAMVANPDMGVNIFKPVIANHVVAIAHHLELEHVLSLGKDKSLLLACGSVKCMIQLITILVDDLIRDVGQRYGSPLRTIALQEAVNDFGSHPHKKLNNFWRPNV